METYNPSSVFEAHSLLAHKRIIWKIIIDFKNHVNNCYRTLNSSGFITITAEIDAMINSRSIATFDDENMKPLQPIDFVSAQTFSIYPLLAQWSNQNAIEYKLYSLLAHWKESIYSKPNTCKYYGNEHNYNIPDHVLKSIVHLASAKWS